MMHAYIRHQDTLGTTLRPIEMICQGNCYEMPNRPRRVRTILEKFLTKLRQGASKTARAAKNFAARIEANRRAHNEITDKRESGYGNYLGIR